MLHLQLATDSGRDWAQEQVTNLHYLHKPVDTRCSVLAYLVMLEDRRVGCLIFGRPESTRCYQDGLTYGSLKDVQAGRAQFSRWEILNLARVWLDPSIQKSGADYVPNAATQAIGMALKSVVSDYLTRFVPIKLDEPWRIRQVISYCDTRVHSGSIYRAAGFWLARTNEDGIQTWVRPVRGLQGHERKCIEKLIEQSPRSRAYRSQVDVEQFAMEL
jgi:hypothetical protein